MSRTLPRCGRRTAWIATALLAACNAQAPSKPAAVPAPAPVVSTMTVQPAPLEVSDVFPARVSPVRVAEIRAQVSGIVTERRFEQGADVRAGQALFTLQSAPFRAEAAIAAATLQRAEVALRHAQAQVARLSPLAAERAISQQAFEEVKTQRDQAAAEVAQAKATLERRELDVAFATVRAPISGRVDQALQTEGALVAATDTTPLARIVQLDQVYVDVRQPAALATPFPQAAQAAQTEQAAQPPQPRACAPRRAASTRVTLLRADGTEVQATGRVLFSGVTVDAGSGDVLVRALVDNPRRDLLPGMFLRVRMPVASYQQAMTVPQEAVLRNGSDTRVWRMDAQGQVKAVPVQLGELVAGRYRVVSGLSAGDRLVTSGLDKLSDGMRVVVSTAAPSPALPSASLHP